MTVMTNPTALVGEIEAMQAKATPGPWSIVTTPKAISPGQNWYEITADEHDPSNANESAIGEIFDPEGEANAALIVAAVNALPTLLVALKARGYMADTLVKLRADLAEEDAEIHAQRIAVIDDTLARASIEGNPTA